MSKVKPIWVEEETSVFLDKGVVVKKGVRSDDPRVETIKAESFYKSVEYGGKESSAASVSPIAAQDKEVIPITQLYHNGEEVAPDMRHALAILGSMIDLLAEAIESNGAKSEIVLFKIGKKLGELFRLKNLGSGLRMAIIYIVNALRSQSPDFLIDTKKARVILSAIRKIETNPLMSEVESVEIGALLEEHGFEIHSGLVESIDRLSNLTRGGNEEGFC